MPLENVSGLIRELAKQVSAYQLAKDLDVTEEELRELAAGKREYPSDKLWKLVLTTNKYGFFDLLPPHGVPPVSYKIDAPFNLVAPPIGLEEEPPLVPLINRPTIIAGYKVDFPLGLPASVLAANAQWIEFYARRGFDILTYKTVRTQFRDVHPYPNWVFLQKPVELREQFSAENYQPVKRAFEATALGYPGYWPDDLATVSMANSFGVPSYPPEWWREDVQRARQVVREGHQVLIVSVVATVNSGLEAIADDFVKVALMAKQAGADIIEANYSCPNVVNDHIGDVYQFPEESAYISKALKEALNGTPLFVKIGYLPERELRKFVELNVEYIDGIVAINTVSAKVICPEGRDVFPSRPKAGISGWAIKARAQEVAKNLVILRKEVNAKLDKNLTILGIGGVLTPKDCLEYLDDIGVNAVESCTGAFLNPHLGLDLRLDHEAHNKRPSRLAIELKVLGKFLKEVIRHPTTPSRIRVNEKTGIVTVEKVR